MQLFLRLLHLHLKRCGRILIEIGILRLLFLTALLSLATVAICHAVLNSSNQYIILVIILALVISVHSSRKDKFLIRSLGIPFPLFCWGEYLLVSSPVLICLLLAGEWIILIGLAGIIYLIAITNFRFKTNYLFFPLKFFSLSGEYFEWISGFRKNRIFLLFLFIISVVFINNFIVPSVILLVLMLVVSALFCECEPLIMIEAFHLSPRRFLKKKIVLHSKVFCLTFIPYLLILLSLHSSYWYIFLYVLFAGLLLLNLSVVMKYSFYSPAGNLSGNMWILSFAWCCFLVPFLIPIPLILLARYYNKAISNLILYLYDYD